MGFFLGICVLQLTWREIDLMDETLRCTFVSLTVKTAQTIFPGSQNHNTPQYCAKVFAVLATV